MDAFDDIVAELGDIDEDQAGMSENDILVEFLLLFKLADVVDQIAPMWEAMTLAVPGLAPLYGGPPPGVDPGSSEWSRLMDIIGDSLPAGRRWLTSWLYEQGVPRIRTWVPMNDRWLYVSIPALAPGEDCGPAIDLDVEPDED